MQWSRIKTVIIIMLAAVDLALLLVVIVPRTQAGKLHEQQKDDVVQMLANNGIAIDQSAIPDDRTLYQMQAGRDTEVEAAAVNELLGESVMEDQGGSIYYYSGSKGWARFRNGGDFEIHIQSDSAVEEEDIKSDALSLLDEIGFSYDADSVTLSAYGGVTAVTAAQETEDLTVYNCTVTMSYQDGGLVMVAGKWLTAVPAREDGGDTIDAVTCLVDFLHDINNAGIICSSITYMSQGYIAAAQVSAGTRLIPVWRVEADTGEYYVNAVSGELVNNA